MRLFRTNHDVRFIIGSAELNPLENSRTSHCHSLLHFNEYMINRNQRPGKLEEMETVKTPK